MDGDNRSAIIHQYEILSRSLPLDIWTFYHFDFVGEPFIHIIIIIKVGSLKKSSKYKYQRRTQACRLHDDPLRVAAEITQTQ